MQLLFFEILFWSYHSSLNISIKLTFDFNSGKNGNNGIFNHHLDLRSSLATPAARTCLDGFCYFFSGLIIACSITMHIRATVYVMLIADCLTYVVKKCV